MLLKFASNISEVKEASSLRKEEKGKRRKRSVQSTSKGRKLLVGV